jgi:uncharacterized protein YbjT (DUF2867 family)
VLIKRQLEYHGVRLVVILQPDSSLACIPAWMTHESAAQYALSEKPHFSVDILRSVRAEIDAVLAVYYNPTNRKSTMVATNDIGAEVATLLTGPAWSGQRVVELGSIVTADEVAEQLGDVPNLDVKAFAVPRAGWAEAFEQFGIPKGHTGPAEEMFEAVNAGWMDLGVEDTEHVVGTTSARDVFEAAQNAAKA